MSNQITLDAEFAGFSSSNTFRYEIAKPNFSLKVACHTAFFPSDRAGSVVVEIDADSDDLKDFLIEKKGDTVTIEQKGSRGNVGNVFIGGGGNVVMSGGKYSMSGVQMGGNSSVYVNGNHIETRNGRTFVNGVEIKQDGSTGKPRKEPRIRVFCPSGSNLEASLEGSCTLASKVPFDDADVEASGSSSVGLAAKTAAIGLSGSGKAYLLMGGGDLDLSVSGSGSIEVQGQFEDAKVDISGMGSVRTIGTCHGSYKASVSGMGSVTHSGSIAGRIKKSVSGMGRINVG